MSVFELRKLEPGRGKRERWHARWAVVETLSGERLAVGRFVYKATAVRAISGASKSAKRLVYAALGNEEPAKLRAMIVLRRYFLACAASEGFVPKERFVYRYPRGATRSA